jgi:hypothetical protein
MGLPLGFVFSPKFVKALRWVTARALAFGSENRATLIVAQFSELIAIPSRGSTFANMHFDPTGRPLIRKLRSLPKEKEWKAKIEHAHSHADQLDGCQVNSHQNLPQKRSSDRVNRARCSTVLPFDRRSDVVQLG